MSNPREFVTEAGTNEMVLNMGPQHPSTHGVLRVVIKLEGETISEATPVVGYLHRGVAKMMEKWTYPQIVPILDRLDYVAAMNNELTYVMAVEELMDIEVPERAQFIRVIMAELNRIASHLIWWSSFVLDLGAITPFLYSMRERETILDLFEMASGARLTYSYMRIGGVRKDISDEFIKKLYKYLEVQIDKLKEYEDIIMGNSIFKARTVGVGVLSSEDAISLGTSGPILRASGVKWDLRKDRPYLGYDRFSFNVITREEGDCLARAWVRFDEIRESINIIRQALDMLPEGEIMAKVPRVIKPPAGEIYFATEAPKGEQGVFIQSDGSQSPARFEWRAPTFIHLQTIPKVAPGMKIADLVAMIGSIDIILGEVDR